MNTNIRRGVISVVAAGALAVAGGGTALADEASYEEDRSFESASAGPNGPSAMSYEDDSESYAEADEADEADDENENEGEDDDGLFGLGIFG
jgi:ribosomal protein L12E/L44/L45/RPP1/RPP2